MGYRPPAPEVKIPTGLTLQPVQTMVMSGHLDNSKYVEELYENLNQQAVFEGPYRKKSE